MDGDEIGAFIEIGRVDGSIGACFLDDSVCTIVGVIYRGAIWQCLLDAPAFVVVVVIGFLLGVLPGRKGSSCKVVGCMGRMGADGGMVLIDGGCDFSLVSLVVVGCLFIGAGKTLWVFSFDGEESSKEVLFFYGYVAQGVLDCFFLGGVGDGCGVA